MILIGSVVEVLQSELNDSPVNQCPTDVSAMTPSIRSLVDAYRSVDGARSLLCRARNTYDRRVVDVEHYAQRTQVSDKADFVALRVLVARLLPMLKWRHHGIGALQAYLSDNVRVHIWDDRLVKPGMRHSGGIHDHRFALESTVVAGALINREYSLSHSPDVTPDAYEMYEVVKAADGSAVLRKLPGCFLVHCREVQLREGDTYTYPKRDFHETIHCGTSVTLVTKRDQEQAPPRVLAPVGATPTNALEDTMEAEVIESIVREAAERLWVTIGERPSS